MNVSELFGVLLLVLFLGAMLFYFFVRRDTSTATLREVTAYERLRRAIGLSVEDGTRLHISLGRGGLPGQSSAVIFAALRVLEKAARVISIADRLPVSSSGDGSSTILAQDTLRATYRSMGEDRSFDPANARLTGATPLSFAAGAMPLIHDEQVSANVLLGNFGSEAGLLLEASERSGGVSLAGSDNLEGQAVMAAAALHPLLGEEVFAGGAYLDEDAVQLTSLRAIDVLRWAVILLLIVGAMLKIFNIEQPLLELFSGGV